MNILKNTVFLLFSLIVSFSARAMSIVEKEERKADIANAEYRARENTSLLEAFLKASKDSIQCAELTDKSPALIFSDYREPSKTHRLDLADVALILALARDEIIFYDFRASNNISTLKELASQPNKTEGDFNLLQIARFARFYEVLDLKEGSDCIKNNRRHSKRSTLIPILEDLHKD